MVTDAKSFHVGLNTNEKRAFWLFLICVNSNTKKVTFLKQCRRKGGEGTETLSRFEDVMWKIDNYSFSLIKEFSRTTKRIMKGSDDWVPVRSGLHIRQLPLKVLMGPIIETKWAHMIGSFIGPEYLGLSKHVPFPTLFSFSCKQWALITSVKKATISSQIHCIHT